MDTKPLLPTTTDDPRRDVPNGRDGRDGAPRRIAARACLPLLALLLFVLLDAAVSLVSHGNCGKPRQLGPQGPGPAPAGPVDPAVGGPLFAPPDLLGDAFDQVVDAVDAALDTDTQGPLGHRGRGRITRHCPIRLPDAKALTTETRERLAALLLPALDKAAQAAPAGTTTSVVLAAAPKYLRPESDMDLPGYRQTGNIMYILGPFNVPGSLVVLSRSPANASSVASGLDITVFLPVLTQRQAIFNGAPLDPDAVRHDYKLTAVHSLADFASSPFASHNLLTLSSVGDINSILQPHWPGTADLPKITYSTAIDNAFRFAREVKTPAEMRVMTYVSQIAAWSHAQIQRFIERHPVDSDVTESTVASVFSHVSALCGARLQAYNPIVGAGKHSAVLHFPTGESPDEGYTPIRPGQFVLVDASGAFLGYASDLTRTYSRAGVASHKQRLIHTIVARAQRAAIDQFKNGGVFSSVIAAAAKSLVVQMREHGYLIGEVDELLKSGVIFTFMPHGLGHRIGLDVHDPIPIAPKPEVPAPEEPKPEEPAPGDGSVRGAGFHPHVPLPQNVFATAMQRHGVGLAAALPIHPWQSRFDDIDLVPGSIMTIEPGVYFIEYLLNIVRNDTALNPYINWEKLDKDRLVDMGGVRIEDVVLINEHGKTVIITKLDH
ncbi:hypothetical protein HK105_207998 [Polyrhizophydium stewartii]|uniref:Xaa-Pro aminopeptidase n=1 Tax=Polyrhizophydium stewartii TaxID=2732419 RepID=A0ABR4MZ50_9FUNG|nr:hypothetical protein HK105_000347 [Polyrhizophydium stewartii]